MSLSRKTGLVISGTLIGLIAILSILTRLILLDNFSRLEETDTQQQVARTSEALADDIAQLNGAVGDWAPWDDTATFMLDGNESYIEANLDDSTFVTLRLNVVLFVDTNNQAILGRGFEAPQAQPLPTDLIAQLLEHPTLLHPTDVNGKTTGIIAVSGGVLLVASQPVLSSDHTGPSRGTLIFGRWLDVTEIERLAAITHVSIVARPLADPALPADFQTAQVALSKQQPVLVRALDDQQVAGYTLLNDIDGQPVLLWRVSVPRLIHAQGQNALTYFALSLLVVGVVFSTLIPLLLERLVLSRLRTLNSTVSAIQHSGDLVARVPTTGRDELANLGQSINGMLGTLERSAEALRASEQRYRLLFEHMQAGFAYCQMLYDEHGSPVDFIYLDVNDAFERLTGLKQVIGRKVTEVIPGIQDLTPELLEVYGRVAQTGLPEQLELDFTPLALWLSISVYSMAPGYFAVVFDNITQRKQADKALRESERRLETLLSNLPGMAYRCANILDWPMEFVSAGSTALLGYSPAELVNQQVGVYGRLIHPDDRARVWEQVQAALAARQPFSLNYRIVTATGEEKHVIEQGRGVFGPQNDLIALEGLVMDVTDRARTEAAERKQRQLSEALRDTAEALNSTLNFDEVLDRILVSVERVITYDAAGFLLLEADRTMASLARYRSHQPGDQVDEIPTLRLPVAQARNLREMLATGEPVIIEDVKAEPEWIEDPIAAWIRSSLGLPIRVQGETIGFLTINRAHVDAFTFTDADRLRAFADQAAVAIQNSRLYAQAQHYADELEERVAERTRELAIANERLQELDRLKSKFVSDVSHELRTPVTSLGLYLELMTAGQPAKRDHYLLQATAQMTRLRKLIDDILDLSRLERQQQPLNLELLDLNELVAHILTEQQPVAEVSGLELAVRLTTKPLPFSGDRGQMLRVIRNLVANALKYTPAGSVQVSTIDDGARVGVQVRDTGMGIATADLPHVFERFYRGQQVAQSAIPGTGLGLAIVREIVEKHGGAVEVESMLGAGSTFQLWLPAVNLEQAGSVEK